MESQQEKQGDWFSAHHESKAEIQINEIEVTEGKEEISLKWIVWNQSTRVSSGAISFLNKVKQMGITYGAVKLWDGRKW